MEKFDENDISHILTALADTLKGYPERELASGWRAAAARVTHALRAMGADDGGAWDDFEIIAADDADYDDHGNLRAGVDNV